MKIKKISLALALLLALSSIGLISCGKKKEGYTVKVSVTDIGTARVYRDTLKTEKETVMTTGTDKIKDSLISKLDSNANGAKITSVKVTYIDEKGKKIEDESGEIAVDKSFEKTYQVAAGKTIIVTAEAEGTAVGDTLKAKEAVDALKGTDAKVDVWRKVYVDKYQKEVAGKPIEVTLPTLSITIEKGGDIIAAQSVKASKNGLDPKDLTTAGNKTTVSATATAIAFDVK